MPGPLDGLVIIDSSWGMPGAVAGMLLADYGARVIKIERPGASVDTELLIRATWDRGKWSVEADLDTEAGVATVRQLLNGADVFIESSGAAMTASCGLSYENVRAQWPEVIYCSITGYGLDGPWRDRAGFDALVAARLGLMAEQAGHRDGPVFLGHPSIGYGTACIAVIGVLAAVLARHSTGRGQQVDVSLLDGAIAQSCMNWWWNEGGLSYLARSGTEKGFGRNRLIADIFVCSDDEYLMIHSGGEGGFKRTMDVLGLGHYIRDVPGLEMSVSLNDQEHHAARKLVPAAFRARPRAEWLTLLHDADIAALPVLRPGEVLQDEQVNFAGIVVEVADPVFGPLRQVGPVIHFDRTPASSPRPAPSIGQHNTAPGELAAQPRSPERVGSTVAQGSIEHALEGIRILDFSSFFAAAYGAKLLSDLGADVIKIEALGGDQMRPMPDPFEACQRGKRGFAVDLGTPKGRDIVQHLAATADVVVHNLRPGKAERIGIGYEKLSAINPALVYCYMPGFGSRGPKAKLKSFAPLISGFTGLLYEGAGEGNKPVRRVLGNEDYYNGFLGAMATLMALEHRVRTGEGQYIECPQLHSGLFAVTHHCLDSRGHSISGLTLDREQMGWGSLYRLYAARDGWICIACIGRSAFFRLCSALHMEHLLEDERFATAASRKTHGAALAIELEVAFRQLGVEEAYELLDAKGVPCEVAVGDPRMPDFLWAEWALESDRVFEHYHREWGWIREFGHVIHLSDTPAIKKGPAPVLGEHTTSVLAELGYSTEEAQEVLASGCVQQASD